MEGVPILPAVVLIGLLGAILVALDRGLSSQSPRQLTSGEEFVGSSPYPPITFGRSYSVVDRQDLTLIQILETTARANPQTFLIPTTPSWPRPVRSWVTLTRGDALFDKQQLHPAMLSYLAALKVMESHTGTPDPTRRSDRLTYSRIWYGVARTLHDREEFTDALRAYQRTLELQTSLAGGSDVCVNVVQTLCNVGRVRHALGDIDGSLEVHRRVVRIAMALMGGRTGHPFVAARLRALGNLLVEAGRPAEAVQVYAEAARSTGDVYVGFQEEDVDGTENARQSARVLARAGLPDPCAATA